MCEEEICKLCYSKEFNGNYSHISDGDPEWNQYCDYIKSAVANVKEITSTEQMFLGCSKLESIDLTQLDTSKVTNMTQMFSGCVRLESIDVSSFDTSQVTKMASMFMFCTRLKEIDLSAWDMDQVENAMGIFGSYDECYCLSKINVTYMVNMFDGCSSLEKLDLSKFDMSQVTDIDNFLDNCTNLKEISMPQNIRILVLLPYVEGYYWVDQSGKTCEMVTTALSTPMLYKRLNSNGEDNSVSGNDIPN